MKRHNWQETLIGLGATLLGSVVLLRLWWFRRAKLPPEMATKRLRPQPEGDALALTELTRGHSRLLIIAHGFLKSARLPGLLALAERLSQQYDILMFDFPGHGQSEGLAMLNHEQAGRDLAQVVAHARDQGYESVGVIGFSLGASAAIMARAEGCPIDAIVSVSSPVAPPKKPDLSYHASAVFRAFGWAMGSRVAPQWPTGEWPAQRIAAIRHTPLLIVHTGWDSLIRRADSEALFALANPPKEYLHLPHLLHASPQDITDEVIDWLDKSLIPPKA